MNKCSRIRSWHRLPLIVIGGMLLLASTGCTYVRGIRDNFAYNDLTNDFVLGWRNRAWANQSWHMQKHCYLGQPYLDSFGEGYRAGFMDVAAGSGGCTPALPPRKYWTWKYQTPEGQAKTAAWFSGYPHGAKAAEEMGAGNWSDIQISETLRAEYRLGHKPPYNNTLYLHNPENWCPPQEAGEVLPGHGPTMAEPALMDPAPMKLPPTNGTQSSLWPGTIPYAIPGPAPTGDGSMSMDGGLSRLPLP